MATMLAGVRPTISLASLPIASTRLLRFSIATQEGSLMTTPLPRTLHQRVGGAQVNADVE